MAAVETGKDSVCQAMSPWGRNRNLEARTTGSAHGPWRFSQRWGMRETLIETGIKDDYITAVPIFALKYGRQFLHRLVLDQIKVDCRGMLDCVTRKGFRGESA